MKLQVVILLAVVAVSGCRGRGDGAHQGRDAGLPPAPERVVATINGLPVMRADCEAAIEAGRVGGSPELVMDEMLSFTLVLNECRAMGVDGCDGPAPVHVRAIGFLERIFPPEAACRNVTDREIDEAVRPGGDDSPGAREAARSRLCEARAKEMRRQWVKALRKNAIVEMRVDPAKGL